MKKRTKILSIILALLLIATLVPTAFVQAFASDYDFESVATDDEAHFIYAELVSIEITKAPDNTTVTKDLDGCVSGYELFDGLEMLLTFDNGETYYYSYDNDGLMPNCFSEDYESEDEFYSNYLTILEISEGTDLTLEDLPLGETEITYLLSGCYADQKITVLENEYVSNTIVKMEFTKAPTKKFTAPSFNKAPAIGEDFEEVITIAMKPENKANSIACNMSGAELTFYRKNGEKMVFSIDAPISESYCFLYERTCGYFAYYQLNNDFSIAVTDLGDYKAKLCLQYRDEIFYITEFSVKEIGFEETTNDDSTKFETTVPTSSDNVNSSTSDTATKDTVSSNNTSNGTVATGNVAVSVILLSVLLFSASIMAVIGRKKQLF